MTVPINTSQNTSEAWEIGAALINMTSKMPLLYKDENGVFHTIYYTVNTEIVGNGTVEIACLTGQIAGTDPTADV